MRKLFFLIIFFYGNVSILVSQEIDIIAQIHRRVDTFLEKPDSIDRIKLEQIVNDVDFWYLIKDENKITLFDLFIDRFPQSRFNNAAKDSINSLEKYVAISNIKDLHNNEYVFLFKNGEFRRNVKEAVNLIRVIISNKELLLSADGRLIDTINLPDIINKYVKGIAIYNIPDSITLNESKIAGLRIKHEASEEEINTLDWVNLETNQLEYKQIEIRDSLRAKLKVLSSTNEITLEEEFYRKINTEKETYNNWQWELLGNKAGRCTIQILISSPSSDAYYLKDKNVTVFDKRSFIEKILEAIGIILLLLFVFVMPAGKVLYKYFFADTNTSKIPKELLKDVKRALGEGMVLEAIDLLFDSTTLKPQTKNELLLIKGRYRRSEKSFNSGMTSREDYFVEINKISKSILYLLPEND